MNFNVRLWSSPPPQSECPVGTIIGWLGDTTSLSFLISEYWFLANGASLSKIQYPELFNVIGTKYGGSGDNFFLPNLTSGSGDYGRYFLSMCNALRNQTFNQPGLPEISGSSTSRSFFGDAYVAYIGNNGATYTDRSGAIEVQWQMPTRNKDLIAISQGSSRTRAGFDFYASRSNAIYGRSAHVIPQSINAYPLIKVL